MEWPLSWFRHHLVNRRYFYLIILPSLVSCLLLSYLSLRGLLCMCVCVVCVYVYSTVCVWRSEDEYQSSPSTLIKTGSCCLLLYMPGELVHKLLGGLSGLCFPSCCGNAGVTGVCCWAWLCVGYVDLNAGIHAYVSHALPTEPVPQTPYPVFEKRSLLTFFHLTWLNDHFLFYICIQFCIISSLSACVLGCLKVTNSNSNKKYSLDTYKHGTWSFLLNFHL